MSQGPRRVEPFHKHFEGHILMLVGGQAALTHLSKQFDGGGISRHIHTQHQGVDEKAHQIIKHRVAPPGDREPNGHFGTGAYFGQ